MDSSPDADTKSSTRRTRRQESSESEGDYIEFPPTLCSFHISPGEGFSTGCTTCLSPDSEVLKHWLSFVYKKYNACFKIRLMVAVNYKREDVVKWLLQTKHVNPNYNIEWRSPIGCAVRMGHLGIVKLLLEAGANVETVDYDGGIFSEYHDGVLSGYNPVHVAVCNDSLKLLQLLVSHGANINKRNRNSCTALHLATLYGHSHLVKWLLSAGAIVNVLQDNGMSALHIASSLGHTDICRLLIDAGAYPSFCTIDGWSALHTAVAYCHEGIVKLLLEAGADISNRIIATGETILHTACTKGSMAIVHSLLSAGVFVNVLQDNGVSALHIASSWGNTDICRLLIEAGANLWLCNKDGWSALHTAVAYGQESIVKLLLEAGADISNRIIATGDTLLHTACTKGSVAIVSSLLSAGVIVNVLQDNGMSVLHIASSRGHTDICRLLIQAGANPSLCTKDGRSALHTAVAKCHEGIVKLLLEAGADISNRIIATGDTILHTACTKGSVAIVRRLLSAGAMINMLQDNGMSALHTASSMGHTDICRLLIQAGANPSLCTKDGWSALHTAVAKCHEGIVKLLLEAGADISNRIIATGDTILHTACRKRSMAIVRLLLKAGVPIESKNVMGNTPLLTSAENCLYTAFFLLKAGANVNAVNNEGRSALGLLISRETTQIPIRETNILKWILLQAGARLSSEKFKKDAWLELNAHDFGNLLSLQNMCHMVVRQTLAPDLQMKVFSLPLPPALKRVMALDDVHLYTLHPELGRLAANVNVDDVHVDGIVYSFRGLAFERADNVELVGDFD